MSGGPTPGPTYYQCTPPRMSNVARRIQPFHALRSLTLQPASGITPASAAALSSLHLLTSLATDLVSRSRGQTLAEYAHLTGTHLKHHASHTYVLLMCCCGRQGVERLTDTFLLLQGCSACTLSTYVLQTIVTMQKWSCRARGALENLTELHLQGWGSLDQEGGPSAGALHTLFQRLRHAIFQVCAC